MTKEIELVGVGVDIAYLEALVDQWGQLADSAAVKYTDPNYVPTQPTLAIEMTRASMLAKAADAVSNVMRTAALKGGLYDVVNTTDDETTAFIEHQETVTKEKMH